MWYRSAGCTPLGAEEASITGRAGRIPVCLEERVNTETVVEPRWTRHGRPLDERKSCSRLTCSVGRFVESRLIRRRLVALCDNHTATLHLIQ